jgi:hypothetical protein
MLLTAEMKQRMSHVFGMMNYSLCFRNCEHIANYVFRGRWVCMQMEDPNGDGSMVGAISRHFRDYIVADNRKIINAFPSTLRAQFAQNISLDRVYPFLNSFVTFTSVDYYLDHAEDTWNYLVIGPMGSGKSRFVNAFFNARVCAEGESFNAVTKEITFFKGDMYFEIFFENGEREVRRRQKIVLIDTIGLCDTEWSEEDLHRLIKNRVSSNSPKLRGVFVLQAGCERITPQAQRSLKALLQWLDYRNNPSPFNFLITKADMIEGRDDEKKEVLRAQLKEIYGIVECSRKIANRPEVHIVLPIYFTSFPHRVRAEDEEDFKKMYKDSILSVLSYAGVIDVSVGGFCSVM